MAEIINRFGPQSSVRAIGDRLYDCGICNQFHPVGWDGDCRDDNNRYPDEEAYARKFGIPVEDVTVEDLEEEEE